MPKQKTHKATKKVLNVRNSGSVTYKKSNGNHKTAKDSSKQIRQRRKAGVLNESNVKRLKGVI